MPATLPPGQNDPTPLGRRIAAIERFLGGLSKNRIIAKDTLGKTRQLEVLAAIGGAVSADPDANPESFCGIMKTNGKWLMKGGPVSCAEKNFDVKDLAIPTAKGTALLYIEVKYIVNRDDDRQAFLPGVEKALDSDIAIQHTTAANYPDSKKPSLSSGIGTLVVPLGKLVNAIGDPVFTRAWCGKITVAHCNGNLTYS